MAHIFKTVDIPATRAKLERALPRLDEGKTEKVRAALALAGNRAQRERAILDAARAVDLEPAYHVRLRFTYRDRHGRRKTATGTDSATDTVALAVQVQAREDAIRKGWRQAPKASDAAKVRTFAEVTAEYLAWGRSCGGTRGAGWVEEHAEHRAWGLNWWGNRLGLKTLADLADILPRVEGALRALQAEGLLNSTLRNRAIALTAFCEWAASRGFLAENPLKQLVAFPKETRHRRRALTAAEVQRLLEAAAPGRRMLYEVALSSGLRANELRSVTVADLDAQRGGLRLDARWTKNRQGGFQYLPAGLVARLAEAHRGERPEARLLEVGEHTARDLDKDLEAAGIPKKGPGGKLDFHALRVAYVSFVLESGADVKTAQTLARHNDPRLTLETYGRARPGRLAETAEAVGLALGLEPAAEVALRTGTDNLPLHIVQGDENGPADKTEAQPRQGKSRAEAVTPKGQSGYAVSGKSLAGVHGACPRACDNKQAADTTRTPPGTSADAHKGLQQETPQAPVDLRTPAGQAGTPCGRDLSITEAKPEHNGDAPPATVNTAPDLQELVALWPMLPEAIRAGMLATARALAGRGKP